MAAAAAAANAGSPAGTMGNGEESGKNVGNGKGKEPSHLSNEVGGSSEGMNVDESDATGAAEAVAQALGGELEEMRDLVVKRAQELEELRNDRVALKNEIDSLKVKVPNFSNTNSSLPQKS